MSNPYIASVAELRLLAYPNGKLDAGVSETKLQYIMDAAAADFDIAWGTFKALPIDQLASPSAFLQAKEAVLVMSSYRALLQGRGVTPNDADDPLKRRYDEITGEGGLLDRLRTGSADGSSGGGGTDPEDVIDETAPVIIVGDPSDPMCGVGKPCPIYCRRNPDF